MATLVLLVASVLGTASFGQSFASVTIELGRDDPKSVFAVDLDADGDLDLLVGSDNDDQITWDENVAGDASLWVTHTIADDALGVHSVHAVDIDLDGDLDVLATTKDDDSTSWYERQMDGSNTWVRHVITSNVDLPKHALAEDIDADGDIDVVVASVLDDRIRWFENDGTALVWTEHEVSDLVTGPAHLDLCDMDGDGDLDIVTASSFDVAVFWFENADSVGGTWTGHCIATAMLAARRVQAVDLDRDGDLDVVSSSTLSNSLAWHENTAGDGSAWRLHVISKNVDSIKAFAIGDLDGDGDLDLVSAGLNDTKITFFEQLSGPLNWREQTATSGIDGPSALSLGDADGDGDLDVFFATIGDDVVGCLLNRRINRGVQDQGSIGFPAPPPGS